MFALAAIVELELEPNWFWFVHVNVSVTFKLTLRKSKNETSPEAVTPTLYEVDRDDIELEVTAFVRLYFVVAGICPNTVTGSYGSCVCQTKRPGSIVLALTNGSTFRICA